MNRKNRLRNKWSVFKENHSTGHICVLIIAINVVFILCSALLISVLPENRGHSLGEILRLAFTLMVNPSGKYIYSEAPISLIFTTIVVLLGMISLTGGTVGFITSIINTFLEKTAKSKRSLRLADHIVILNYNRRVPAILSDYCFDDMNSTYIVILTDREKEEVEKKIQEMYERAGRKKRFKNVIVRSGDPLSGVDLDRIALKDARTVLIMTPETETEASPEAQSFPVSKLFLYVTAYLESKNVQGTDIVVETFGSSMDEMIRSYHTQDPSTKTVSVEYNSIIGKILGITAIMPTINDALRQLFSFEGIEVYTKPAPKMSVIEELKRTRSVMPVYNLYGERVYLAESEAEFAKVSDSAYTLKKPLPEKKLTPVLHFPKNEIIIVGSNRKLPYILESLVCFRDQYNNSELHAILCDTADKSDVLAAYYADPRYTSVLMPERFSPIIIRDLYLPMEDLKAVVNEATDTLLFLSDDDVGPDHLDEKPLLYWSGIKGNSVLDGSINAPDVVIEIKDAGNVSIIQKQNEDQILVSDDFLGRLYAQLGKNPLRKEIIMDMITSEGDTSSVGTDDTLMNAGDIVAVKAADLFPNDKVDLTFSSKRELILWFHEATGGAVLPIGCAKDGVTYLFARTDNEDDGLDSCVLLGIREGQRYNGPTDKIVLTGSDELIAFVST